MLPGDAIFFVSWNVEIARSFSSGNQESFCCVSFLYPFIICCLKITEQVFCLEPEIGNHSLYNAANSLFIEPRLDKRLSVDIATDTNKAFAQGTLEIN